MNAITLSFLVLAAALGAASGAPQNFDFKDPKGVNNVVFKLDAPLESINGTANGISGTVTFDPANPAATKGKIVIATSSMHVGNPTMKGHLHGKDWMDVASYPEITFETTEVKRAATADNSTVADVAGKLTIKGMTKDVTVPVKFTYLKDRLKDRFPRFQGDLLVLRANFKVKRSDFGINAGKSEEKVADEIDLSLSLAGMSPR
jgi:polyisoprenoid-binding protein YceI